MRLHDSRECIATEHEKQPLFLYPQWKLLSLDTISATVYDRFAFGQRLSRAFAKGLVMKRFLWITGITAGFTVFWLMAQSSGDPLIQGYRETEVASVADAMEQLYGQQAFMSHEMRPLEKTKFAGPAWTVLMKKAETKEGGPAVQGML